MSSDENSNNQKEEKTGVPPEIVGETSPEEEKDASGMKETVAPDKKNSAASAIDDLTGDTTTVENIENIEKVEITGKAISTFMNFFPHLVVGLISLVALAGLIYIMWVNGNRDVEPSETARSLITYLVAVFTIVIALTLTLMTFFSNQTDFKERFALGKEVLTILIGVLGTIIGFYFGSAAPEKPNLNSTLPPISSNSNSAANNDSSATATAASFTANSNSSAGPDDTQKQLAKVKEREGFEKLIAGDYDSAISAFQTSEDAWNGYHNTYDIARLLRKNKTQMNSPDKKKEVFGIIVSQYSYGAPPDLMEQIKSSTGE